VSIVPKNLPIKSVNTKIQLIDIMPDENCGCPYERIHECDVFMNGKDANLRGSVAWLPNNQSWDEFLANCSSRMRKRNHATARKGYYCEMINVADHIQEMHDINVSKPVRQGFPMSKGYFLSIEELRHAYARPDIYSCQLHTYRWFGVFTKERKMVGYILWFRKGQLSCYGMILGHGDYLKDEIMYFLHFYIQKFIHEAKEEYFKGVLGTAYYDFYGRNRGLTFWKQQAGFAPFHLIKEGHKEEKHHIRGRRPHP
jgi:hypothetical protein